MTGTLRDELRRRLHGRIVIVGIGNPLRGDDGVGCAIARALLTHFEATSSSPTAWPCTIFDGEEVPESFAGPVVAARPDTVLLVDAVELETVPGSTALLDAKQLSRTAVFTHRTPLGPLADYLHHSTGADVLLLGIQPGRLLWGEVMGPEVRAAADALVAILTDALDAALAARAAGVEMMAC